MKKRENKKKWNTYTYVLCVKQILRDYIHLMLLCFHDIEYY